MKNVTFLMPNLSNLLKGIRKDGRRLFEFFTGDCSVSVPYGNAYEFENLSLLSRCMRMSGGNSTRYDELNKDVRF